MGSSFRNAAVGIVANFVGGFLGGAFGNWFARNFLSSAVTAATTLSTPMALALLAVLILIPVTHVWWSKGRRLAAAAAWAGAMTGSFTVGMSLA